jgi:hypothetical protein
MGPSTDRCGEVPWRNDGRPVWLGADRRSGMPLSSRCCLDSVNSGSSQKATQSTACRERARGPVTQTRAVRSSSRHVANCLDDAGPDDPPAVRRTGPGGAPVRLRGHCFWHVGPVARTLDHRSVSGMWMIPPYVHNHQVQRGRGASGGQLSKRGSCRRGLATLTNSEFS